MTLTITLIFLFGMSLLIHFRAIKSIQRISKDIPNSTTQPLVVAFVNVFKHFGYPDITYMRYVMESMDSLTAFQKQKLIQNLTEIEVICGQVVGKSSWQRQFEKDENGLSLEDKAYQQIEELDSLCQKLTTELIVKGIDDLDAWRYSLDKPEKKNWVKLRKRK